MNQADHPNSPDAGQFSASVSSELAEALRSHGPDGERALNLLCDAAAILADPTRWHAPYEMAQSCCRNAIDSILKLAPSNTPGIQGVQRAVTGAAKDLAGMWRAGSPVTDVELGRLAEAVDALLAEEGNPGGQRIRQIGFLFQQQTSQELGVGEVEAVRNSWTRFYKDSSGVLHGSGTGPEQTRDLFAGVLSAFAQLFLGLPERADRLRELAALALPSQADADEIALLIDPRAGKYFFRAATSPQWLSLLPLKRLLPEPTQWPARPYLHRLLQQNPDLVCSWVDEHLDDIGKSGPGAVSTVVGLLDDAGMAACSVLTRIMKSTPDRSTLLRIGYWARDVALEERAGPWLQVVEAVLRAPEYRDRETWEAAHLLGALVATVHPGSKVRGAGDQLGVFIRFAVTAMLSRCLVEEPDGFEAKVANDLSAVVLHDPPRSFMVVAIRAVLDIADVDARLGIPLAVRVRGLESKVEASALRDRIVAVHLAESYEADSALPDRRREWWDAMIPLAGRVVAGRPPRGDEFDALALALRECPPERRAELESTLQGGLGTAPRQAEIDEWRAGYETDARALPTSWRPAWEFSALLPPTVLASWEPLLAVLRELSDGETPSRPEPLITIASLVEENGGLSTAVFAGIAMEDGPAAAVRRLVATPVPRRDFDADQVKAGILGDLVAQDPQSWLNDMPGVLDAAGELVLQAAYFNALHRIGSDGGLPAGSFGPLAEAAFAVRPAPGSTGPAADQLRMVVCILLHRAWSEGSILKTEADALAWLDDLVTSWMAQRVASERPWEAATSTTEGIAFLSLIAWGVQSARGDVATPPEPLASVLGRIVGGEPDDQALAIVGFCLSQLVNRWPEWVATYSEALYSLDEPWRPARVWLRRGRPDAVLLGRLDRSGLLGVLCAPGAEQAVGKVALAFLEGSDALGTAATLFMELCERPGGPEAVSEVLSQLAGVAARAPEASAVLGRAVEVWAAALDCVLPPAALTGASRFVLVTGLDDQRWLELMARTAEQQPALGRHSYLIAERAAQHPGNPNALTVAAVLLGTPVDTYTDLEIQARAAKLFAASAGSEGPERERLRLALINAGAIEDAFGDRRRTSDGQ